LTLLDDLVEFLTATSAARFLSPILRHLRHSWRSRAIHHRDRSPAYNTEAQSNLMMMVAFKDLLPFFFWQGALDCLSDLSTLVVPALAALKLFHPAFINSSADESKPSHTPSFSCLSLFIWIEAVNGAGYSRYDIADIDMQGQ
jgi:hypothetical protein